MTRAAGPEASEGGSNPAHRSNLFRSHAASASSFRLCSAAAAAAPWKVVGKRPTGINPRKERGAEEARKRGRREENGASAIRSGGGQKARQDDQDRRRAEKNGGPTDVPGAVLWTAPQSPTRFSQMGRRSRRRRPRRECRKGNLRVSLQALVDATSAGEDERTFFRSPSLGFASESPSHKLAISVR